MPTLEEIQTSIDNISVSNDSIDYVTLATQASNETSCLSFCAVKTVDMLPNLSSGEIPSGQIVHVDEIGGPVFSSNKKWYSLVEKNLIKVDGGISSLWAWGWNCQGNLGNGSSGGIAITPNQNPGLITFCDISPAQRHTVALSCDGFVYAAGCNEHGQLGVGTNSAIQCTDWTKISDGSLGGSWCDISASYYNTHLISTSGKVYGIGYNGYGVNGNSSAYTNTPCNLAFVNLPGCCWCKVYSKNQALFVIRTDGAMFAGGYNPYGDLGTGDCCSCTNCIRQVCGGGSWKKIAVSQSIHTTYGIKTDGSLYSWGYGYYQSLGLGCGDNTNVAIPTQILGGGNTYCDVAQSAGGYSGAAIKTDGTLWTWGWNTSWQLGIGCCNSCCFSSPVTVAGGITNWCSVVGSYYGYSALTTDGRLWGWGANSYGEIGDGTNITRCSPTQSLFGSTWCSLPDASDSYNTFAFKF
jgi:alpha-tubulin suppressor-like RCC1 family protein